MKGGAKGGACKGGGHRFRTLVPIIYNIIWSSDESFGGYICIFWHNHYGASNIDICPPPLPPPFSKFLFFKKMELHILPESKINVIRHLVPKIRYFKVKMSYFCWNWQKGRQNLILKVSRNRWFFDTLNSNLNNSISSSRNDINLIFGANVCSNNTFYKFGEFEKGRQKGGHTYGSQNPHMLQNWERNVKLNDF